MASQFHETVMGREFFGRQVPELTKAIRNLAENTASKPTSATVNLPETTRNRLLAILESPEKAEELALAFTAQVMDDDEKPARMGYYLAKAILDGSVEDLLVAVCGWSITSLLNIAENGVAYP